MNQLTELRNIIVGEQQEELHLLKLKLEQTRTDPQKLADMLPDALRLSSNDKGEVITDVQPYLSRAVIKTVVDDPHGFAEVLYPALVPAIRLMVSNSIRVATRRINATIESTTTAQGLKWRIEALRTGESYSAVVVRKTLKFRVEQLYLLKPDSGILIEHLVNEDIGSIDSDAVAGMFTAIQSFVRDSFNSSEGDNLNQISVGDLNVWLVHSPIATLACVVRGSIPYELRDKLESVQDKIFSRFATQIKIFDGSQATILGVREVLEPCLQLKLKTEKEKEEAAEGTGGKEQKNKKSSFGGVIFILLIIAALVFWSLSELKQTRMQRNVENLLFITPGIMPTVVKWQGSRLHVVGLKAPDAEIPWEKFKQYAVDIDKLDFSLKTLNSYQPIEK